MGLPLLIGGIVLLATHGWFGGQHTVGAICLAAGAILFFVQFIWVGIVLTYIKKKRW